MYMWLSTAIVFWKVIGLSWIEALLLAACTAPTDPVLANSIVNGRFADLHIHPRIRSLMSAESAANDGAVAPFFSLAALLLTFPVGEAFAKWTYLVVLYQLGVAVILGFVIGRLAHVSLKYSEQHNWIDKKNFLVFELALATFTNGVASMMDVTSFIAVFVCGLTFSWDGWFTEETEEAHVQGVLDMLINLTFFIYFGSTLSWSSFNTADLPIWKLIVTTILVLFVRRLPAVLLLSRYMTPLLTLPEALFVGWFGPVGVGAIWYQVNKRW